jgi:asparagine synthase (glutamine-hydrolysing)
MCGIAGYVGIEDRSTALAAVERMLGALARRGPDAEGVQCWEPAVFGHRRLAIFDLSDDGRQPMLTPDGQVGVVFNGAIYNFVELRGELEGRGFAFRSRTDTEVLLHGYRAWGMEGLVGRLRGMFAFGLWDEAAGRLFLVRDRLGVKPLLYVEIGGGLVFASTARALESAGVASAVDPVAVAEFLEYGYVTDARSIYEGVRKVPAASVLEWRDGQTRQWLYWDVPAPEENGVAFEEAVERTGDLLLDAVRLRLQADVPVAALLSAGVDSSLVCWAIGKLGADIQAFTVATPGDPEDEAPEAARLARRLGVRHEAIEVEGDPEHLIEEVTDAYAEPFACASALGMLRVCEAVRRRATVLLTGDGGDDVFLGYPGHRHFYAAQRLARALPGPLARLWPSVRVPLSSVAALRRPVHFVDYAAGGIAAVIQAKDGLPFYERAGLLGERLAGVGLVQRNGAWSPEAGRRVLTDFLRYEHEHQFFGEYMTKVDGASMRQGLEARSPFLDQEIWNFAARLPYALRLRGGTLKAVLRELARRKVGEEVARGRKRGFTIPVNRWLAARWRKLAEDAFADPTLEEQGWMRRGSLAPAFEAAAATGWVSNHFWYCLVLEFWLRRGREASR